MEPGSLFFQFFELESSTYTYLIADVLTREAAIIDSVLETAERDWQWIERNHLKLKYIFDTHVHADHITGAGYLRQKSGAQSGLSYRAGVDCADLALRDGDEFFLGNKVIQIYETPGHTDTCLTFLFENRLFTGDALLIGGCGRTDFQQGSADRLYDSIHEKIFTLPEATQVYPGHDYKGLTSSTVGLEKKWNLRLGNGKSKNEFIKIMSELKLDPPKKIKTAVPANLRCGISG